jgi:hypothetical protein
MKKLVYSIVLLLFALSAGAQQFSVLGKVIDSATGQPMSKASAFCQNTTFGTITNNDGLFYMNLPNGGYDLIISFTGYEKQVRRISNTLANTDTMVFMMVPQDNSMAEVAVVASNEVPDGWIKYGSFFTENFIGTTPNAANCHIENPETLRFFYTKKRNRLKVTAREDVIVMNAALGYRVRYQLDSFSYDYNTNISQYTGYPLFEEIDTTEEVQTQWQKNRAKTYLGSRLHFMRSFYDSLVQEEGFIVEKMTGGPKSTKGVTIENLYDSTFYFADSSGVDIDWQGKYRISYRKVLPDKKFLQEFKLPAGTNVQVTLLDVSNGFVIEQNGYFYEQYEVINSGYWAWKKLAELLPYNYEYE